MPRLSHETLEFSSPDLNGNSYTLSLDPGTPKKGESYSVYEARLRSKQGPKDPKDQKIATAKFPTKETGSRKWADEMVKKATIARNCVQKFNNFLSCVDECKHVEPNNKNYFEGKQAKDGPLTFLIPQTSCLNSVSFRDKKRTKGEFFVFEDKLKHHQTFVNSFGEAQSEEKASRSKKSSGGTASYVEDVVQVFNTNRLYPRLALCEDPPPPYSDAEANVLYDIPLPSNHYDNYLPNNHYDNYLPNSHYDNYLPNNHYEYIYANGFSSDGNNKTLFSQQESRSRSSSTISSDDETEIDHAYLQAFIHHAFCSSNGLHVICNLKGSRDKEDGSYTFSTPTFHSISQSYGSDDMGVEGMDHVIKHHKCSRLCHHLPSMEALLNMALSR